MNPSEQQLHIYQSANKATRLFHPVVKRTKSIICLEDLSNEIFYDIFDYLDGCHLYEAFSNLNTRFQNLLVNSCLLLKINLSSDHQIILEHNCMNVINPNKSQIISLHLSKTTVLKQFFILVTINSLFNHLQSLVINGIAAHKLPLLLVSLVYLPHLQSLTLLVVDHLESFDTIYQLIFRLPFLKYSKLAYGPWKVPVTLPIVTNERFSPIEHLNIDIDTTLNELISILSYTPQLRRLTCEHLFSSNINIERGYTITLPNLTHIYLDRCRLHFNDFEIFIKKISSQLQVLRFTTSENIEFLDADRWQQLILKYIPHLRKFEFEYEEKIGNNFQLDLHQQINQFTSAFWIERQWYFELETDAPHYISNQITYSIHSYRKKWYHSCQYIENGKHNSLNLTQDDVLTDSEKTISTCQDIELIAINRGDFEQYKSFIKTINPIFQLVRITCLNIDLCYSSTDLLIDFINHLPNLNSLNVSCLPLLQLNISSDKSSNSSLVSSNNKITKVNLEKMVELEQAQFLIDLCPHMKYLQVGCTSNFDLKLLIRFILMKSNIKNILQLRLLCIHFPTADETVIQNLQTMIDLEKLHSDYSIRRVLDKIYLQWK